MKQDVDAAIYGRAGTGKTTFGGTYPKELIICDVKEQGTDSIRELKNTSAFRARTWNDCEDFYWYLKDNRRKFKSAMVDTVSQGQDLAIMDVLGIDPEEVAQGELGKWGSMSIKQWGEVASRMKTWISNLRDIRGVNIVFIAHDRVFEIEDEDIDMGEILPTVGPRLMPSVAAHLNANVNLVGNTFIRETSRKIGKRVKTKIEYCMRIGPHANYVTKLRKPRGVALPSVIINPTYEDIAALLSGNELDK